MNNGFDFNKWNDDVQKFTKNQKNMEAKIAITTTNEGKIAVQVVNMKQEYLKYKEQLQKLAIKIAQSAYIVMYNTFCRPRYASEEDYEKEVNEGKKLLSENLSMYLEILFEKGSEDFYCLMMIQRSILESSYQIRHMKYDGQKWVTQKGEYLENGCWVTQEGRRYFSTLSAEIFDLIIN